VNLLDLILRPLRMRRVTTGYPPEADIPDRGRRGTPVLSPARCDDERACVEVCPTSAIQVIERGTAKRTWKLDYGACIFCGACVESCPNQAIIASNTFELARRQRESLVASYELGGVGDG
jgi:formate hydrogenlyase subunit 6/NADH:ubiquinone oxidoreductase subunit I